MSTPIPGYDEPPPPAQETGGRRPDPGSRRAGRLALLLLVPALLAVVGLQQCSVAAGGAGLREEARERVLPPAAGESFTFVSQMMVRFDRAIGDLMSASGAPGGAGGASAAQFIEQIDSMAVSPTERVRGAIIAGAMLGPEAFEERSGEAAALVRRAGEAPRGLSEAATQSLLSALQTPRARASRRR
ncbi:MAG: hypothetical protein AAFR96_02430 [Planctomycetota bacterium]